MSLPIYQEHLRLTSDIAAGPTLSRLVFFLYRFCRDLHSKFHFHIGLVSVLYRFAHLTSFSPKISLPSTSPKQKLIEANLNAPLQKPEQNQSLLWILYRSDIGLETPSRKLNLKVITDSLIGSCHPGIQTTTTFALDSVSVSYRSGSSYQESQI